jgi:hypothetical protein
MKSVAVTVAVTPTLLIAADNQPRTCYLHSTSGSTFLGGSTVTVNTGLVLPNNVTITVVVPFGESLYAVTNVVPTDVRVLTADPD